MALYKSSKPRVVSFATCFDVRNNLVLLNSLVNRYAKVFRVVNS